MTSHCADNIQVKVAGVLLAVLVLTGCFGHTDSQSFLRPRSSRAANDAHHHQQLLTTRNPDKLSQQDHATAFLEYVESVNCSNLGINHSLDSLDKSAYAAFDAQARSAVIMANLLNSLFRSPDSNHHPSHNDALFSSLVHAMVASDDVIYGSAIAFNPDRYSEEQFCTYAYRDHIAAGDVVVRNLKEVYDMANQRRPAYEWFWSQRNKTYSKKLWNRTCPRTKDHSNSHRIHNFSTVFSNQEDGKWSHLPYYDCTGGNRIWLVTYSVPFFGCRASRASSNSDNNFQFRGAVAIHIDLTKVDVNQCSTGRNIFSNTHRCRSSTQCEHIPGHGFKGGSYVCRCKPGYYYPDPTSFTPYFNGTDLDVADIQKLLNQSPVDDLQFQCLPCPKGCPTCHNNTPCFAEYDVMMRGIPLGIQSFCMTISVVLGFVIIRLRKTKVMKASMWVLLEIILIGALLLYSTVVIQYFEPTDATCLLIPWFRELGFAIVYGALILKVYRVLAEFQSRKAHRVHVRDKDLLKYLTCLVVVVIGYMAAWTAVHLDHIREGNSMLDNGTTPGGLGYYTCKAHWWDYVIEIGEFLFLCFGIYLCYCVRSAPSDYLEAKYVSWTIYNETVVSALLHITRHFLWLQIHPDYIFLMYFLRCQLTVSLMLMLVLGPKLWYAHRPPEDDHFRGRAYSTSDVHDSILPESMKLHAGVNSNGDLDVGDVNLSEMDPEDIRAELKRLYTQLQIYKTKTMRKDNPHISKRRGGRKQTHRRFSLQPFHHKHRHHHHDDHDHEMSKTPEESTNSAEGVAISMAEESSVGGERESRTPTVTFKPGHKSLY